MTSFLLSDKTHIRINAYFFYFKNMKLVKQLSISTGHRLPLHEGGCSNFHGHNYKIKVIINIPDLDVKNEYLSDSGYVVDFGVIKKVICDKFDHKFVMYKDDKFSTVARKENFPGFVFVDYVPTAENMATDIAKEIKKTVIGQFNCVPVITIKLWETDQSYVVKTLS